MNYTEMHKASGLKTGDMVKVVEPNEYYRTRFEIEFGRIDPASIFKSSVGKSFVIIASKPSIGFILQNQGLYPCYFLEKIVDPKILKLEAGDSIKMDEPDVEISNSELLKRLVVVEGINQRLERDFARILGEKSDGVKLAEKTIKLVNSVSPPPMEKVILKERVIAEEGFQKPDWWESVAIETLGYTSILSTYGWMFETLPLKQYLQALARRRLQWVFNEYFGGKEVSNSNHHGRKYTIMQRVIDKEWVMQDFNTRYDFIDELTIVNEPNIKELKAIIETMGEWMEYLK